MIDEKDQYMNKKPGDKKVAPELLKVFDSQFINSIEKTPIGVYRQTNISYLDNSQGMNDEN